MPSAMQYIKNIDHDMMLSASIRLIGEKNIDIKTDSLGIKSPQLKVDNIQSINIKKLLNLSI
jgi:hypothetical protein